jgi:hypothetical protein
MVTAAQNTVMKLAASANAARDQHAAAIVPVAFLGRTSTLELQDPRASLHRQARSVQAWLPPGFRIVAWYWDIESGGLDLEDRSQTDSWRKVDGIGIPRDGGMADLLTEAAGDRPRFAAVACEDINRSARDSFNALKLERTWPPAASPCSPPTSPSWWKEPTPPPFCCGGPSRPSPSSSASRSKRTAGKA